MGLAVHFLWSYGFTFGNNNIEENVMPCGCRKGLTNSVQLCLEFHGVWLAIGVGLSLAENLTLVRFFSVSGGVSPHFRMALGTKIYSMDYT